jgi:hypothetical protein
MNAKADSVLHDTQYRQQKYTYGLVEPLFLLGEHNECSQDWLVNLLGSQGTYCTRPREDHLDRVYSDQKVLEVIRWGRLVLFIGSQDTQNN